MPLPGGSGRRARATPARGRVRRHLRRAAPSSAPPNRYLDHPRLREPFALEEHHVVVVPSRRGDPDGLAATARAHNAPSGPLLPRDDHVRPLAARPQRLAPDRRAVSPEQRALVRPDAEPVASTL